MLSKHELVLEEMEEGTPNAVMAQTGMEKKKKN
jgi:hypothetical protein